MKFFSTIKISHKLPALIILLTMCTASIVAWAGYYKSKAILIESSEARLLSTVDNRVDVLSNWILEIRQNLDDISTHPTTHSALLDFSTAWNELPKDKTAYLKSEYITKNPNPLGSKENLDFAPDRSAYSQMHKKYHGYFRKLLRTNDYYDVFLFNPNGDLIYSVFKEQDYATNLNTGEWSKTDLGNAFRAAKDNAAQATPQFFDFKAYGPSHDAPASFMSQAVKDKNGQFIGVLAYQMPAGRLQSIMQHNAGLGKTGESFLVGADHFMRSDSRFSETSTMLTRNINTKSVNRALAGETGVITTPNHDDKTVVSAFKAINMMGVKWAVLVEEDLSELTAPMAHLRREIFKDLGIAFLILWVIGLIIARAVSKPIIALVQSIDTLASGTLTEIIPFQHKNDELGQMSKSMVTLQGNLAKGDIANRISLFKGSAFDGASTAMIMLDTDMNVSFGNASAVQLFQIHKIEFQAQFPNFNPEELVGQNLTDFYENPSKIRTILSDQSCLPHREDISIGQHKFDLSISMVKDGEGRHVGNTLEWDHVTLDRTNSGIMTALNRQSVLVEYNMDGSIITANENFLDCLGYTIEEVKGKHHKFFMDEVYQNSPEYTQFWDTLRAGHGVSDKREHYDKSGQPKWLNTVYNPVVDKMGKPFKVVKIATDITRAENFRAKSDAEMKTHADEQEHVVSILADHLRRLSQGDLSHKIEDEFTGEYEKLKSDYNHAIETLRATMKTVVTNTIGIQNGAREISQASDDMAKRTENQAASLEQTAAALDEITATVKGSAKSADEANTVVIDTKQSAEKSGEIVRDTVDAMDAIKQSSGEIEQIISVIDEIAFQTNLLALNAGVEAARAGEAGRGFAVVASEVRALAQRSSGAAKDIKALISASGKHVDAGVELVSQTGSALELIIASVAKASALVEDISGATQEQSIALAQVNMSINDMDRVTQQNAAMVEQSTAASHSLTNEAQALSQLVQQFNFDNGAPNQAAHNLIPAHQINRPIAKQQERAHRYFATQNKHQSAAALKINAVEINEEDWQEF